MNHITPFDDYPIHQAASPIAVPSSTDRNFYDRYWFNGIDPDTNYIFEIGIGVYPNRHIIDAHFSISYQGKQYSYHASQRMNQKRVPIEVGPISLTINDPMKKLTFTLDDPDKKLNCKLQFIANSSAHQEPRSTLTEGVRTLMDTIRFTQLGKWTGTINTEAGKIECKSIYGTRDRSWGIRPIGEAESGAAGLGIDEPGVYWRRAPIHFKDFCTHFGTFEDQDGNSTQISGHKLPLYSDVSNIPEEPKVENLYNLKHSIQWQKGTRWSTGAIIEGISDTKEKIKINLETLGPKFFCRGIGYQHEDWKHGIWKGESATGYEVWNLDEINPEDHTFFHTHQIVKATLGSNSGIGTLENLVIGRHDPSGFKDFFDGAP